MKRTATSRKDNSLNRCREQLDRFFAAFPNPGLSRRAAKALHLLAADEKFLLGKAEGWTAGIIYAVANLDRQACGVPGLLNSEFTEFFSVSMETVRRRAANVASQLSI